jgi:hypothetical protein
MYTHLKATPKDTMMDITKDLTGIQITQMMGLAIATLSSFTQLEEVTLQLTVMDGLLVIRLLVMAVRIQEEVSNHNKAQEPTGLGYAIPFNPYL